MLTGDPQLGMLVSFKFMCSTPDDHSRIAFEIDPDLSAVERALARSGAPA